jgi:hypothetical protein
MPTTTWPELMDAAQQVLQERPAIKMPNPDGFVYYYYEPSFGEHFSLFLIWKDEVCHWERTIWESSKDFAKFGVLEHLRYLGQTLHPTFERSSGSFAKTAILPLLSLLKAQSLPLLPGPSDSFMIDGYKHTLNVGQSDFEVVYQWRTRPAEWAVLDEIGDVIFRLNERLNELNS